MVSGTIQRMEEKHKYKVSTENSWGLFNAFDTRPGSVVVIKVASQ